MQYYLSIMIPFASLQFSTIRVAADTIMERILLLQQHLNNLPTTSQQHLNEPSTNFRQCVVFLHLLRSAEALFARNGESPGDDSRFGLEHQSFEPGGARVESQC